MKLDFVLWIWWLRFSVMELVFIDRLLVVLFWCLLFLNCEVMIISVSMIIVLIISVIINLISVVFCWVCGDVVWFIILLCGLCSCGWGCWVVFR